MGTYGEPIVAAVPAVSSLGTQYATDVNAVLDEIVTRVEAKVPFSALSGGTFDLNGEDIEDVNYISFSSNTGTPSVAPSGRLVYSDGELWFINTLGAIQLTSGTGLNAAAIGGITGDYGSPNPAELRFVDTSQTYIFYDDYGGGAWARTKALSLDVAAGATSAFYSRITFGGAATSNVILFEDKPVSGRSVVVFDTAGQLFHNTDTNTVENDIYMAAGKKVRELGKNQTWTFNKAIDGLSTTSSPTFVDYVVTTGSARKTSGVTVTSSGTVAIITKEIGGLEADVEVTSVTVRINKTSTGSSFFLISNVVDGVSTPMYTSGNVTTSGWQNITVSTSFTVLAGTQYFVAVSFGDNNNTVTTLDATYNR